MAVSQSTQQFAEEEAEMDMTPMIDVTFLLLIFFMCTLSFATAEGMLASHLPKDVGVFSSPPQKNPEEPIYIKLLKTRDGTVVWVGDSKIRGEQKYDSLYEKINNIVKRTPDVPVIIDPEINVSFQDIIYTLNACRKVQEQPYGKNLKVKFAAKALAEEQK